MPTGGKPRNADLIGINMALFRMGSQPPDDGFAIMDGRRKGGDVAGAVSYGDADEPVFRIEKGVISRFVNDSPRSSRNVYYGGRWRFKALWNGDIQLQLMSVRDSVNNVFPDRDVFLVKHLGKGGQEAGDGYEKQD